MKVLAVETSADPCSLALTIGGQPAVEVKFEHQMRLLEQLVDKTDEVLRQRDLELAAMDLLSVDVGPGSFTGLRVGVMTAKAWASVLGLPVLGVTSLEAVAQEQECVAGESVLVLLRARFGWLYSQAFERRENRVVAATAPVVVEVIDLATHLDGLPAKPSVVAGDGLARHGEEIRAAVDSTGASVRYGLQQPPSACTVATIAGRMCTEGQVHDALGLVPMYLAEPAIGPRRT